MVQDSGISRGQVLEQVRTLVDSQSELMARFGYLHELSGFTLDFQKV